MVKSPLNRIRKNLENLKNLVKDNGEALGIVRNIEQAVSKPDRLIIIGVKELMNLKGNRFHSVLEKLRKDEDFRRFIEISRYPWGGNVMVARLFQILWVITAALAFMMGVYLFFPPYLFFGEIRGGNATALIERTLEIVSKNPQVLMVIDPLFKVLGFVMMIIAILSLYQAHIIGTAIKR